MGVGRGTRSARAARRRAPNPLAVGVVDYGYAGLRHLSALNRLDLRRLAGERDPGPPVLLLPGVNETWRAMEAIARRLIRAGYSVDRVPRLGLNRLPIPRTAELVADHLRREDTRGAVLVGHSKGGIVGKMLLAAHGDELALRGLVAIASPWRGSPRPGSRPTLRCASSCPRTRCSPSSTRTRRRTPGSRRSGPCSTSTSPRSTPCPGP